MQVTETSIDGLKRTLEVVVPQADLDARLSSRLTEVKDQVAIKGFRRGKVPVPHIRKVYGRSLMADIIQKAIDETSRKAMADRNERPAMQPKITLTEDEAEVERLVTGKSDLKYSLAFEALPVIQMADFSTLKLERLTADVSEEAIDNAVGELARQNRTFAAEDGRAAGDGDQATIDFVGRIDGVEFDGGKGDDVELVLGEGGFLPGFEDGVKGAKAGDSRAFPVAFPEGYGVKTLAGKTAQFEVKIKAVGRPVVPAIDDELAKGFGVDSLVKLRERVKEQIATEYARAGRDKLKRALLDELDKTHTFPLPQTLVASELDTMWTSLTEAMKQQGRSFPTEGKTEDEAKAEYRRIAERRVRLGLLIGEIGDKAEIKVSQEELREALFQQARRFPGQTKQVYEFYANNPGALAELRGPIFEDKVIDHIVALAKPTEKKVPREELLSPPRDVEAEALAAAAGGAGHDPAGHDHAGHDHHHHGHDHAHGHDHHHHDHGHSHGGETKR